MGRPVIRRDRRFHQLVELIDRHKKVEVPFRVTQRTAHILGARAGVAGKTRGEGAGNRSEEALDVGPLIGMMGVPAIDEAPEEVAQRSERVISEMGLGPIELDPLPLRVGEFGQLARGEATCAPVAEARQAERAR